MSVLSFPGKGSGALKKKVIRFLDQKEIKQLYHRVEKDGDKFSSVILAVAKSYPFQNARGGVTTAGVTKPGLQPASLTK